LRRFLTRCLIQLKGRMLPSANEKMLAAVEEKMDAACWTMQRTLVDMLVEKALMTERALCDEVRTIYLAQREMLGEEGAAHLRAWMRQLGCTDIPP
jgi:hypothetical protein